MTNIKRYTDETAWNDVIFELDGHPLQLWGWGEVKAAHGWRAERLVVEQEGRVIGAAQVLLRRLPPPFRSLCYIPRGPSSLSENRGEILLELKKYVKNNFRAVALTVEPDWHDFPPANGWKKSTNTILIPRTIIFDLKKSEDELLSKMTKKTRQYIRKSAGENIAIRQVKSREALAECMTIYKQTAARANFALHDDSYYEDIFEKLGEHSVVTAAYHDKKIVAFLWLVISGETAFELYGGMNDDGQRMRANYTLKWQTMTLMKKWGIARYDVNGLLNDGVSAFKQGFADHEDMLAGTYDTPLSPLYILWARGLPLGKKLLRQVKKRS